MLLIIRHAVIVPASGFGHVEEILSDSSALKMICRNISAAGLRRFGMLYTGCDPVSGC